MKDFIFLLRQPDRNGISESEMNGMLKKWEEWFGSIAAQGKLKNSGIRLSSEGKVLRTGGIITDGPFVELREQLNGFIVVQADNLDEALTLAHGCPALEIGGSVEVRPPFEKQLMV